MRRGDLLVRLDDTAIRDASPPRRPRSRRGGARHSSRRAAVPAHEDAARRAWPRRRRSRTPRSAATPRADEAAKARVVTARQQLQRTEVRAPFDGIVSDRKVSAGDTAQIGKELLKVIDPQQHALRGPGVGRQHRRGASRASAVHVPRQRLRRARSSPARSRRVESGGQRRPRARSRCWSTSPSAPAAERSPACMPKGASRAAARRGADAARQRAWCATATSAFAWRVKDGTLQKVAVHARRARCAHAASSC